MYRCTRGGWGGSSESDVVPDEGGAATGRGRTGVTTHDAGNTIHDERARHMTRECGPSPPMRNRIDALHTTVCLAIIRISRRNRLIANSQMSRAQTPYTWHMGTHHSLDRLFAVARQERRLRHPLHQHGHTGNTQESEDRRRAESFRGLYAEPAYWESLDPHEQVRHIVRALAIQHPDWVFCGPTAAIMHGLDCSYRLAFPICIVASPGAHHQDTRHISHLTRSRIRTSPWFRE